MRGQVISMLEQRITKAVDARPTEDELEAMARDAYQEILAHICGRQRREPFLASEHSKANSLWADYYDRLAWNGGHIPFVSGEEEMLEKAGWSSARIDALRSAIDIALDDNPISRRLIDIRLREYGYQPHNGLRDVVERALYPVYRDACLEAERQLQKMRLPPYAEPQPAAETAEVPVSAPLEESPSFSGQSPQVALEPPAPPVPTASQAEGQAMSDFIELAIQDLAADEKWDSKSGRQARSTIALFELLIGKKPFAAYSQSDFAAFKRKTLLLPERYDMSSAKSREEVRTLVAARENDPEFSKKKDQHRSNRTRNRHISSLRGIFRWAADNGQPTPVVNFDSLFIGISKAKRGRNLRPATPVDDVGKLFALPVFAGCLPHSGGTGAAVLSARFAEGDAVIHDAFYWVPMLLYYTGARREELCKLRPGDVFDATDIPYIWIDFTEFGRIKNEHSMRPVPLHSELIRLGFIDFVRECRDRGYDVLFPELRPTNDVQNFGDVYYKNVWRNLKKAGHLTTEATNHGMRHRFSTELKAKKVFSEFRRDLMGHAGANINEEIYSDTGPLLELKSVVEELPSVTNHLASSPMNLPPKAVRRPQPQKRRKKQ